MGHESNQNNKVTKIKPKIISNVNLDKKYVIIGKSNPTQSKSFRNNINKEVNKSNRNTSLIDHKQNYWNGKETITEKYPNLIQRKSSFKENNENNAIHKSNRDSRLNYYKRKEQKMKDKHHLKCGFKKEMQLTNKVLDPVAKYGTKSDFNSCCKQPHLQLNNCKIVNAMIQTNLDKPEYNSIRCTIKKMNQICQEKVVPDFKCLPPSIKKSITRKISTSLNKPIRDKVYKNLVSLSISDKEEEKLFSSRIRVPEQQRFKNTSPCWSASPSSNNEIPTLHLSNSSGGIFPEYC